MMKKAGHRKLFHICRHLFGLIGALLVFMPFWVSFSSGFVVVPSRPSEPLLPTKSSETTTITRRVPTCVFSASSPTTDDVSSIAATPESIKQTSPLQKAVENLKKVLEREYVSFFNPMRTEYYAKDVTFDDPMISISGVSAYQNNVDMLAGRTLLGKLLFEDASINLHSVVGGKVVEDEATTIQDIVTRWTLRVTVKILPWKPTARFSGISVYKVKPTASKQDVVITGQIDYWDSVNLIEGGTYSKMDPELGRADFLNQLKPGGFQAATAAPEVPYSLLRRGKDYEIRRYPAMAGVCIKYGRRDEGFGRLGAFCAGMEPLGPAMLVVNVNGTKTMTWPLAFAPPDGSSVEPPEIALEKTQGGGQWGSCKILEIPSAVVAVKEFTDASMEPVVRKADRELRACLKRDGIEVPSSSADVVRFAQYDAIFSMGKRRGECWINLEDDGHPW